MQPFVLEIENRVRLKIEKNPGALEQTNACISRHELSAFFCSPIINIAVTARIVIYIISSTECGFRKAMPLNRQAQNKSNSMVKSDH